MCATEARLHLPQRSPRSSDMLFRRKPVPMQWHVAVRAFLWVITAQRPEGNAMFGFTRKPKSERQDEEAEPATTPKHRLEIIRPALLGQWALERNRSLE